MAFAGLMASALLFSGCPVGVGYAPGIPGKDAIDEKLYGSWKCQDTGGEVLKIRFSKSENSGTYQVRVLERGPMYVLENDDFIGYCTEIKGLKFVYFKPENEERYYCYCYRFDGNNLITHDVSLLVGGAEVVQSIEAHRKEIEASIDKEGWGKETKTWRKVAD